uniref:Transposase n=1 Tax=Macrostomum lignano TaxID=282301 RepID=A0A1I8FDL9_9PLAT
QPAWRPLHCGRAEPDLPGRQAQPQDERRPHSAAQHAATTGFTALHWLQIWAERHHLELNQPQPFNGSATRMPPAALLASRRRHGGVADRRVRLPDGRIARTNKGHRVLCSPQRLQLHAVQNGWVRQVHRLATRRGQTKSRCHHRGSGAAVAVAACVIAVGVTLGIRFRENPYDEAEPDSQSTVPDAEFRCGAQLRLRRFQGLRRRVSSGIVKSDHNDQAVTRLIRVPE